MSHALQEVKTASASLQEAAQAEKAAREACEEASEATEASLRKRTEVSTALAQAKDVGDQKQRNAVKAMLEKIKAASSPAGAVDLVIRIGGSFEDLGIKVDEDGTVLEAPSGLFDKDYSIVAIDGKRFKYSMRKQDGEKDVILRCKNEKIMTSMSRVPSKLTKGMAFKLMQVQVEPDKKGFGIDLTDFNTVASVVPGGAAAEADLKKGDILVAVDGVNLGAKKLVQVMERGHSSYFFSVVRPAPPGPTDTVAIEFEDIPSSVETSIKKALPPAEKSSASSTVGLDVSAALSGLSDAALKATLDQSLGKLQQQDAQLGGEKPVAPRILRVEPANGNGVTVEWMPVPVDAVMSHYQLEWKLHNESKWTHTDASSKLETTLVTKGSLRPNGGYQFRVRACDRNGQWGPFTEPLAPVRPDGGIFRPPRAPAMGDLDAMSTISEEFSTVSRDTANAANSNVNIEMLQKVLVDQRQAMEEQYKAETIKLETVHAEQLKLKQLEGEEWRSKFIDAAGTRMQAVLDAKEEVRSDAEAKMRDDLEAASKAKHDAAEAVRRAREAEDFADACRLEVEKYKEKYETAHKDARLEVETEARRAVQTVMSKAAQEIKDKVRVAEIQADTRVERAIRETKQACEAEAETKLRAVVLQLEQKTQMAMQAVQTQSGAGLTNRIQRMQEKHDAHLQHAIKEAVALQDGAAEKRLAAAVTAAKKQGVAEAEARLQADKDKLEKQLIAVRNRIEGKADEAQKAELARAVAEERARCEAQHQEQLKVMAAKMEQRLRLQVDQMSQGIEAKVRDAVAKRERELVDEDGKVRDAEEATELREQLETYRVAASEAAKKWGSGNDDFEEAALAKGAPQPESPTPGGAEAKHVLLEDDEFDAKPGEAIDDDESTAGDGAGEVEQRRERRRKKKEQDGKEESGGKPKRDRKASKGSAAETRLVAAAAEPLPDGVVERQEVAMLRERHQLEMTALNSKHDSEERLMMDDDATGVGAGRRATELQALRDRQMGEAIALGLALAQSDSKQMARAELTMSGADALNRGAALAAQEAETPGYTKLLGETRRAAGRVGGMQAAQQRGLQMADDDDVAKAVEAVRKLETQLELMVRPQSELQNALEVEKREHEQTTKKLRQLLDKKGADKEEKAPLSASESQTLADALGLLQLYERQSGAMQAMLKDASATRSDEGAEVLQQQLAKQEGVRRLAAAKLAALLERAKGRKAAGGGAGDEAEVGLNAQEVTELRAAMSSLEQHGGAVRDYEARVEQLHAHAKRQRLERLQEAKQALYELRRDAAAAVPDNALAIPIAPIAAAEDGFSMAIDWVAPESGTADRYHLQWREQGERAWSSSEASEQIGVPCCTKGNLRTHAVYEFRVRAHCGGTDRWGPWSPPTQPTKPSIQLQSMPSRPELTALEGLVVQASWSPPLLGKKATVVQYEVQWCICGGGRLAWSADQQAVTSATSYKTSALRQGRFYYSFRVRALVKTYASNDWSDWSPPAAPVRAVLHPDMAQSEVGSDAAPSMLALRFEGRDATESEIESQLERAAESCPSEVRSTVQAEVRQLRERHAADREALRQLDHGRRDARARAGGGTQARAPSEVGTAVSAATQPSVSRGVDTLSTWD